jgi:hypothetical protein
VPNEHETFNVYLPPSSSLVEEESEPIPPYHIKGKTLGRLRMFGHRMRITLYAPPTYYDVGDYIHGSMIITLWKSFKVKGLKVLLELCNHAPGITTKISNGSIYGDNYMTVAAAEITLDILPSNGEMLQGKLYQVPFALQVPYVLPRTCCARGIAQHTRLPPSLVGQTDVEYIARYRIKGVLTGAGNDLKEPKLQASTRVSILPSYATPQVYTDLTKQKNTLTLPVNRFLAYRAPAGTLAISVNPPTDLALAQSSDTENVVPVTMSFVPSKKYDKPPPEVKSVAFQLHCKTVQCKTGELAVFPCERCENLKVISTKNLLKSVKPISSIWASQEYLSEVGVSREYRASIKLPLLLEAAAAHDRRAIVPTFDSCFVSRRYELEVKVRLQRKGTYALRAPITVVASRTPRSHAPITTTVRDGPERNPLHDFVGERASNTMLAISPRPRREHHLSDSTYVAAWELKARESR